VNGVLDASAFVDLLVGRVTDAEAGVFDGDFAAPDLFLVEVASGLRRSERLGVLSDAQAQVLLAAALELPIELHDTRGLVERAFEMRHAVTVHDACYVALAEELDCGLLTSDRRLARAVGDRLPVVVV
jgi:predicted nucleic acid-binding protein